MIAAQYFDGVTTRLHPVHLVPQGASLHLHGDGLAREFTRADIQVSEPFERAPVVLTFQDGSHCAVHPGAGRSALLACLGYKPSRVERLQRHSKSALTAVAALAAVLLVSYLVLLPMLTEHMARQLPPDALAALGDSVERKLHDKKVLQESRLAMEYEQAIEQVFWRVAPGHSELKLTVKLKSGSIGANAIALPNGTIVITDMMVRAMHQEPGIKPGQMKVVRQHPKQVPGDPFRFEPQVEERLAAVLAHEIAHLEKKHALRKLVRVSLTGMAAWALWGDYTGALGATPLVFTQAKFSREMEAEADARALDILKQRGIPASRMVEVFERMQWYDVWLRSITKKPPKNSDLPAWMVRTMGYLASHPAPAERVAAIRAAR
jgi:Zn-dependent protease with chaperone function